MIFECPKCRTTHSKPEREIGDGTEVACRKCSVKFWVTRGGVSELPAGGGEAAALPPPDPFSDEATVKNEVGSAEPSEFHQASTEVMTVPPNLAKKVAEAKKNKEALAGGTAALGGGSAADAFAEDVATRINSKDEIHDIIAKSRESGPQPEPAPPAEEGDADLGLSVPDTLGRLEEDDSGGVDLSLSEEEERPSKPPSRSKPMLAGKMPEFPSDALREWVAAMRAYLLAQKIYIKIALGTAGVLVFALFVTVVVWIFSGSDTHIGFVDQDQTLVAGPGADGHYPKVATIERGEEVVVFDSGTIGDFVMVRDLMGRAGFLPRQSVSDYRPAARSGVPFVGCRQSPIEETHGPCVERAHIQFDSCREICEQTGQDDMACLEQCQRQMLHCVERCEHATDETPAVPEPEPVIEPPVVASPAEPEKTPTKPKKKKKKKKKRRKR